MAKKLKRGQASPEPNVVVESTPIAEAVVAEKPKPQKTFRNLPQSSKPKKLLTNPK